MRRADIISLQANIDGISHSSAIKTRKPEADAYCGSHHRNIFRMKECQTLTECLRTMIAFDAKTHPCVNAAEALFKNASRSPSSMLPPQHLIVKSFDDRSLTRGDPDQGLITLEPCTRRPRETSEACPSWEARSWKSFRSPVSLDRNRLPEPIPSTACRSVGGNYPVAENPLQAQNLFLPEIPVAPRQVDPPDD